MAGPWEQFQPKAEPQASGPWAQFSPTAQPQAKERSWSDILYENIIGSGEADTLSEKAGELLRAGSAGAMRGATQLVGLPGTLLDLADVGAKKIGILREDAPRTAISGAALAPLVEKATGGYSEYRSPNVGGKIAGTVGEFFGGGAGGKAALVGGTLSEIAGMATEGTPYETPARIVGGIGGSILAGTPRPTQFGRGLAGKTGGEADELAAYLASKGVKPYVGQVTGSEKLAKLEGVFQPTNQQLDDFTAATLKEIGIDASHATPRLILKGQTNIVAEMDDVLRGVDVTVTPTIGQNIIGMYDTYFSAAPRQNLTPRLAGIADEILDAATSPSMSTIPATTLRKWRTTAGSYSTSKNEAVREAAHALREILDDALENTLRAQGNADGIKRLAAAREKYRNFLLISDSVAKEGRLAARGTITPERLSAAARRSMSNQAYATGKGTELAKLGRAGVAILGPLPPVKSGGVRAIEGAGRAAAGLASTMAASGQGANLAEMAAAFLAGAATPEMIEGLVKSGMMQSLLADPRMLAVPVARSTSGLLVE